MHTEILKLNCKFISNMMLSSNKTIENALYIHYKIEYRIKNMFSNSEGDFKPI